MSRFLLPLGAFAALVLVLAIGIRHSDRKGMLASPLIGRPAPAFALRSLTDPGRIVAEKEFRGRPYLLNVWGSWCYACREEHQMLLEIQRSKRVSLIGINWKDEDAAALAWLAKLGDPYEMVLVDQDSRAAIDWGVTAAPETYLVDAAGTVVFKHVGPLTPEVWQRQILPKLPGT